MLWMVAVALIVLWMLGLSTGYTMDSFIHVLYAAAVALLVVGLSQEVIINQKLRHVSRSRGSKQFFQVISDQRRNVTGQKSL